MTRSLLDHDTSDPSVDMNQSLNLLPRSNSFPNTSLCSSSCSCTFSRSVAESLSSHIFLNPYELMQIQTVLGKVNQQQVGQHKHIGEDVIYEEDDQEEDHINE